MVQARSVNVFNREFTVKKFIFNYKPPGLEKIPLNQLSVRHESDLGRWARTNTELNGLRLLSDNLFDECATPSTKDYNN